MPPSVEYDTLYLVLFADRQFACLPPARLISPGQGCCLNSREIREISAGRVAGELALLCFGRN